MRNFTCEFMNPISGMRQLHIEAMSFKEAVQAAQKKYRANILRVWEGLNAIEQITDAENIMFEMDANNVDEIIINEGMGIRTIYTRKQIERSLFSQSEIKKYRACKALDGSLD